MQGLRLTRAGGLLSSGEALGFSEQSCLRGQVP